MRGLKLGIAAGAALCLTGGLAASPAHAASTSAATITPSSVPGVHLTLPRGVGGNAGLLGSGGVDNLAYSGGPVENAGSTNYSIFWEPSGSTVSSGYDALINRFFGDIGGSTLYGTATQYYQQSGGTTQYIANSSSLGGSWVDTSPYPAPVLQDSDIQAEVQKAMAANGWTGGIGHEFFVFTAKGEISCIQGICSNVYFCAYHSSFGGGGSEILYANQPYTNSLPTGGCNTPTSPNNNLDADSTINVVSHELMETVTDPSVGDSRYAWMDSQGQENGDKCNFNFGPTNSQGADLTANGHPYIVQQEWSNRVSGCSMS